MSVAVLTWTPPKVRSDGKPLAAAEIDHTEVYDNLSVTPLVPIGAVPGAEATFATGELSAGVHQFTVVVVDVHGHRSAHTQVASLEAGPQALAVPNAASNLSAALSDDPPPKAKGGFFGLGAKPADPLTPAKPADPLAPAPLTSHQ